MAYTYRSPVENGYTKFKLTKKQHNQIFPKRKIRWNEKYEYYYNEHQIILHKLTNWKAILIIIILFPIIVLLEGVVHFKECWTDMKKLFNQKKYGSFVSDHVQKNEKAYQQVMDIIKGE